MTACPTCGLPAEILHRWVAVDTTAGPIEHLSIRCARLHHYNLPVSMLSPTEQERRDPRRSAD